MDKEYLENVLSKYANIEHYKEMEKQLKYWEEKLEEARKTADAFQSAMIKEEERLEKEKHLIRMIEILDNDCWKHFFPEWKGTDVSMDKNNCSIYARADFARMLTEADDYDKALAYIEGEVLELSEYGLNSEEIKKRICWEDILKEVEIRRDYETAFKSVRDGYDLAGNLRYAFDKSDIEKFIALHRKNRFRKKIETLLNGCNYHYESGALENKRYDEALANFQDEESA